MSTAPTREPLEVVLAGGTRSGFPLISMRATIFRSS